MHIPVVALPGPYSSDENCMRLTTAPSISLRLRNRLRIISVRLLAVCAAVGLTGAKFESENFVVTASTPEVAQAVAETAETSRRMLAEEWFGEPLASWSAKCPIVVDDRAERASGATSYAVRRGRVVDLEMRVRGPIDEVLRVIVPHEVNHTVLVTRLGRFVPRWADEGAAMLVECAAERQRQRMLATELLLQRPQPDLTVMLTRTEYPVQQQEMQYFYAVGFSLTEYLVSRGGKRQYVEFLSHATESGWPQALRRHYGFESVTDLQTEWFTWATRGEVFAATER